MRQGLNAKFSYADLTGTAHSYRVRCSGVRHGVTPIFTESAARIRKVFYPHRSSLGQFVVDVEMKSQDEYRSMSNWLTNYIDWAFQQRNSLKNFPFMVVAIPSRKFIRAGVPIQGFEWGDKAARMSWGISIVFETAEDVTDWTGDQRVIDSIGQLSQDNAGTITDPVIKFFYPSGQQLSGSDTPDSGTYAVPITLDDIVTGDTSGSQTGSDIGIEAGSSN